MTRWVSVLFAVVFLCFGILGFIPYFLDNGLMFRFFRVNGATNCAHLMIGTFAVWSAFIPEQSAKLYFQVTGTILGIWAILGFLYEQTPIFNFFANSPSLTWLHVIMSVIALIIGFGSKE